MIEPTHRMHDGMRVELSNIEKHAISIEQIASRSRAEKVQADKSMRASRREELLYKLGLSMDDWKLMIGD